MFKKPKRQPWHEIFNGPEEQRYFYSLSRNQKYVWRSLSAIAAETKLTLERVEEITEKYFKLGIVIKSSTNNNYAYWENVDIKEEEPVFKTISEVDKENRLKIYQEKGMKYSSGKIKDDDD